MTLGGYYELTRAHNALLAALGTVVGAVVASGGVPPLATLLAAATVFAATAMGNVINDIIDHELDVAAHPDRPIPTGRASRRGAALMAAVLGLGAVSMALPLGTVAFVYVLAAVSVIGLYELLLKAWGLIGNVAIGALTGATFTYGALIAGNWQAGLLLGCMAAAATIGREIYKDLEDMEADRSYRTTLPQQLGPSFARAIAGLFVLVALILSPLPLPWFQDEFGWSYSLIFVADGIFLIAMLDPAPERAQQLCKVAMSVALVVFLIASFF